jgi:spore coat protein U-like protein
MKRPLPQRLTVAASAALAVAAIGAVLCARDARAIPPACSVSVESAIAFGAYDPLSTAPLDSTGTILLEQCAPGQVTISIGTGQSGSYAPRAMRGAGGDVLAYNLFLDAARTRVWGDGTTAGTSRWPSASSDKGKRLTVYARVFAGQDVPAGAYADTLTVTIDY